MNKILLVAALTVAGYFALLPGTGIPDNPGLPASPGFSSTAGDHTNAALENAISNHLSNQQLAGQAMVVKILPDDNKGSRHQRFIVKLNSGRTVLVAHNIDLAQRIDSLRTGDTVAFFGEYEWNQKGGVMHWTHHDPQGRHPGGWIKHNGQTYQ